MPVRPKETTGQVLRGICPKCGQVTKRKTVAGIWVSRCAHPGKLYEGRMVPGGKKTVPVIPDSVDRGILPSAPGAADVPAPYPAGPRAVPPDAPGAAVAAAVGADPPLGLIAQASLGLPSPDPIRGMIPKNEIRDDEQPQSAPVPSSGDPVSYDVRASLETIAEHARGLAGALAAAQTRIREFEGLIANAAVEQARLHRELEDVRSELDRVTDDRNKLQAYIDQPYPPDEDVADRDIKPPNEPESGGPVADFDPAEVLF